MGRTIMICMVLILSLQHHNVLAFWGGSSTAAPSGLDVVEGYDLNTATTMTGTVTGVPERDGTDQHTTLKLSTSQGAVSVVLGPWWYWEKQAFVIVMGQELVIAGSLAQGRDGGLYLFAQKVTNRNSSTAAVLRDEAGKPLWSRPGAGARGTSGQESRGGRNGSGMRSLQMRGGRR